ncbi:LysR family transcriptional regulator [Burkholderia sp. 22PA0106]|uniref:LysR family transcriptional regulator n=1 Tax=Burkholderia sp. 22PA0106 TaxID=3237371 RepID=UPI0039C13A9A
MMIDELRSFIAVIDAASLTRAATGLYVSQSTVSKRIQRLEAMLGATLFDRNAKPPRPTALAGRIYEQAVPLLRALEQLHDIARDDAAPVGTLRFGLPQVLADIVMFDAVVAMKQRFAALEVKLLTDWSTRLQDRIERGALDAAMLMLPEDAPLPDGLAGSRVARFDVKVVQSAAKPLAERRAAIASLAAHEWILNPDGCGYRAALERALADQGHALRLGVDTYDTDMQLRLVASGLGLGLVPHAVLKASPWRRQLRVIEAGDFDLKLDIWLVFAPQLGNFKRAVAVLTESVAASFADQARQGKGR